jgi:molybdopterin molybdotransferase
MIKACDAIIARSCQDAMGIQRGTYCLPLMLSIPDALQLVLVRCSQRQAASVAVSDALGLTLAEDITSDVDSPPHDKSSVDGYAVLARELASGQAELTVLEEVTAGQLPTKRVSPGHCARIMTGAPIPEGADAVVMVERTQLIGDHVRISDLAKTGQNIMLRASSLRRGETVLYAGQELRPAEIGLLSEVGRTKVQVIPPVRIAILSTGNELVDASRQPAAGQIRNSNGPLLAAAARQLGAILLELGIARDDRGELRRLIEQGLTADVLVLAGGVSAGVLDLVPAVLRGIGVEEVFHKVSLKPGKPLWFGVYGSTLVFGLPGNPVSTFVCFELFVRAAVAKLMGRDPSMGLRQLPARLATDFIHRGDRPTYFPAIIRRAQNELLAKPVRWGGSADLRGLTSANALIHFPAGDRSWAAGESVEVLLL